MKRAEAVAIYRQVEPAHRSHVAALTAEIRILTRLQAKRRRARKLLREIDRQIRVTRAAIKRLTRDVERDLHDQMPPLRLFGERQTD